MKTIYLLNPSQANKVVVLREPDNFDITKDVYVLPFNNVDSIETISVKANSKIIDGITYDHLDNSSDKNIDQTLCLNENWIWTDNKNVLNALLKFSKEIDCYDFEMNSDRPEAIDILFAKDYKHYKSYVDADHLDPLVNATFVADFNPNNRII